MSTSSDISSSDSGHSECLKLVTRMAVQYKKKYQKLKAKYKKQCANLREKALQSPKVVAIPTSESPGAISDSFIGDDGLRSPHRPANSSSEMKLIYLDKRAPLKHKDSTDPLDIKQIPQKFTQGLLPPQTMISESNYDAIEDDLSQVFQKEYSRFQVISQLSEKQTLSKGLEVIDKQTQTEPSRMISHCRKCHYYEIDFLEYPIQEIPFERECIKLRKENEEFSIKLANLREAVSIYLKPVKDKVRQSIESSDLSSSVSNTLIPPIQNFQPSPSSSFSSAELGYANEETIYKQPPNTPSSTPYSKSPERTPSLDVRILSGWSWAPMPDPPIPRENKQTQYDFKPATLSVTSQVNSLNPQPSADKPTGKERSNSNPAKMKEEKLQRSNSEKLNMVEWSIHKRTHPLPGPDSIYAGIANIPKRSLRSGKKISQTAGEPEFLQIPRIESVRRAQSPEPESSTTSVSEEEPLLDLKGIKFEFCHCLRPHTNDKPKLVMNAIPIKATPGPGGRKKRGRPRKYLRPENMQSATLESKIGSMICMTCGKLVNGVPNHDNEGSKKLDSQARSETNEVSDPNQEEGSSNKSNEDYSDDGSKCPQCLRSYHTMYRVVDDMQPESPKLAKSMHLRTTSEGTSSRSLHQRQSSDLMRASGDKPISEIEDLTFRAGGDSQGDSPSRPEDTDKQKQEATPAVHQNVDESPPKGSRQIGATASNSGSADTNTKVDHSECRKLACPLATLKEAYPDVKVLTGKLALPIGEYEGEIVHGAAWGVGNLSTPGGDLYSGDFVFGLPHGLGRMNKADGLQLDGQFSKGTLHGWVRIKYPSVNGNKHSQSPQTNQNGRMMEEKIPSESDRDSSEILLARKANQNGNGVELNASAEEVRRHRSGEVHLLTNPSLNVKTPILVSDGEFQGDSDSDFYIGRNKRRTRKSQKKRKQTSKSKKPAIQAIAVESLEGAPTDGLDSPMQNLTELTDGKLPPVPLVTPASQEFEGIIVSEINMGKGQLRFQNGDEYSGDFWGDHMHGFGKMKYANGDFYYGEFQEALREGDGIFYRKSDDSIFVGNFHRGHFHGMIVQYRPASHIAFKNGDKMFSVLPLLESEEPLLQD